jgi:hypothetical protein
MYDKTVGRVSVSVSENGGEMHDYGFGCTVSCIDGWNDSCPKIKLTMSVEELRDLRYLLDRAIVAADDWKERRRRLDAVWKNLETKKG